jgi:hypothetical protein
MTDTPDIEELARRYLDLWQDQTAALVNDPEVAGTMGQLYAAMSKGMTGFFATCGASGRHTGEEGADSTDIRSARAAPSADSFGTAPVAPASGGSGLDVADLATRIATLEERVRTLETALAASGGGPTAASRKPRR